MVSKTKPSRRLKKNLLVQNVADKMVEKRGARHVYLMGLPVSCDLLGSAISGPSFMNTAHRSYGACPRRECGLGGSIEMKELMPPPVVQVLAGVAFGLMLFAGSCSSPGGKEKDAKSVPTPLDIVQAIQTAPPGPPRADISKQYIGMLVECEGRIVGITETAGKEAQVQIAVRSPSGEFARVGICVLLDKSRRLSGRSNH